MPWLFAGTALATLLALPPTLSVTRGSRDLWTTYEPERFHTLLFFERAVNLGSGVSPFVPILIVAVVCGFWAWSQLRRVTFAEHFWGPPLCSRKVKPGIRSWGVALLTSLHPSQLPPASLASRSGQSASSMVGQKDI